ncbi:tetratricopeptide repeat protein [Brevirhabdus sp.]|uniref:tetratricopeptide repeat protein n=1 Tax=Brevirhabdus sp. TaxID=2004514 RepID=UPI004058BF62
MKRSATVIAALALGMTLGGAAQASGGLAGPYLAARQASSQSDFRNAVRYYTQALVRDQKNPALMESLIISFVGLGELGNAIPVAERLREVAPDSQIGSMVLLADRLKQGKDIGTLADGAGELVTGLTSAWQLLGEGEMSAALAAFDAVIATDGLKDFGLYHKALALALAGDMEGADAIFSGRANGPMRATRNGVIAHVEVLSQLERNDDALSLINKTFPGNGGPMIQTMRERLSKGETLPFDIVTSAADGQAEVFYTLGAALQGEANENLILLYSRMAEYLRPQHVEALLLSAALLETLGQHDLATEAYDRIPRDNPVFPLAEIGRAEALSASDKPDAAIEVLQQLAKSHPEVEAVFVTLGDMLRRMGRHKDATDAYDKAIALIDKPSESDWVVYYTRGITLERQERWQDAEADFRQALKLRPDQPLVLNYLGYSFVEKGKNLDEALKMIERAVAERPDDGYITDSLGWVFYRLGRYQEAVAPMERAVELMPVDPVINDHLGDVLWQVGRQREAEFQWRRALSFDPDEKEAARIRRKLEVGLTKVLADEGTGEVSVAKDETR